MFLLSIVLLYSVLFHIWYWTLIHYLLLEKCLIKWHFLSCFLKLLVTNYFILFFSIEYNIISWFIHILFYNIAFGSVLGILLSLFIITVLCCRLIILIAHKLPLTNQFPLFTFVLRCVWVLRRRINSTPWRWRDWLTMGKPPKSLLLYSSRLFCLL